MQSYFIRVRFQLEDGGAYAPTTIRLEAKDEEEASRQFARIKDGYFVATGLKVTFDYMMSSVPSDLTVYSLTTEKGKQGLRDWLAPFLRRFDEVRSS